MKEYNVRIREILEMTVKIKANSLAEAEEIAEQDWNEEKYVLDASHFVVANFEATPARKNREMER